jgi:hypothetical protein
MARGLRVEVIDTDEDLDWLASHGAFMGEDLNLRGSPGHTQKC